MIVIRFGNTANCKMTAYCNMTSFDRTLRFERGLLTLSRPSDSGAVFLSQSTAAQAFLYYKSVCKAWQERSKTHGGDKGQDDRANESMNFG